MSEENNVKKLQEKVVKYFCDRPSNFPIGRPYNCCESILLALGEYFDINSELIPKIGTAIGAGVSLNGLLCGSISSVAMIIGIKYGRDTPEENPEPIWKMMDEYINAFKRKFGHVNCRQLTGLNLKTPEGLKEYFEKVHDYDCAERLKFAVEKAIEILASF
ncbi:MAG TPA: C_GCAxxG_C_C family protein [Thermoplasmatales archaeon]|nr:C_GCAxxG_C_C family protein [Thermoplasmatales archaeon]